MAFTKLPPVTNRLSGVVSVAPVGTNNVLFNISADVAAALDFTVGNRVDVALGNDADLGCIGVQRSTAGSSLFKASERAVMLRFIISRTRIGVQRPQSTTCLPWSIDGDMLVIDARQLMPTAEVTKIKAA